MTTPWLLLCALSISLLGPKTPIPATDPGSPATTLDPKNVPGKPGKGATGPDQEGLATPPSGLRFVYITPSDLIGASDDWAIRSDGGLGLRTPHASAQPGASAQVRVPRGARLRWMDCAISGTSTAANTFAVRARLVRDRYDEQPYAATHVRVLGQIELANTRAVARNEQGATFGAGVKLDPSADSVASDDGWFTLHVAIRDTEARAFSLRACRIGYEPA